jgi:hypothetical protein
VEQRRRPAGAVASVTASGLLAATLAGCGPSGPAVTYDGQGDSFCLSPAAQSPRGFTVGVGTVTDTSADPVTFTGARPVGARDTVLADAVIVPYRGGDAVGTGAGLTTDPRNPAARLVPGLWRQRRLIPGAVLPATGSRLAFHGWQLVFGIRRLGAGRAAMTSVRLTYQVNHQQHSLAVPVNITYAPLSAPPQGGCPG